jgi:signal peptidase I
VRDIFKGVLKFLGVIAGILVVAGAIAYFFFVRVVEVGHNAMAPTILMGDSVLVWRTTDFELGDVALCLHPSEPNRYVLGRVVGRPGQTIRIERGILYINNQAPDSDIHTAIQFTNNEIGRVQTMVWGVEDLLDHDHTFFYEERRMPTYRSHEVRGGPFLLSDNRTYVGEDSRTFGEVSELLCIGKVFMRLLAADGPAEIPHAPLDIIE